MRSQGSRNGIIFLLVLVAGALSACLETTSKLADEGADPPVSPQNPPSNRAPTISGKPATQVVVGNTYTFTPTASDADGDTLSFAVQNKPNWAQFNASTGRLSGTAMQGTEGMYNNIQITATDGTATASLPQFSIQVTQTGNGVVTLSWVAPTENTDGSPLTDLDSYTIYYGQESRNYTNEVDVTNPGMTTYVVENLVPDTYYFAITASNMAGMESNPSNEAVFSVN